MAPELFPDERTPPTHILDHASDRVTRCGLKDAYPQVLARFVRAHVDGWGMVPCPDCLVAEVG